MANACLYSITKIQRSSYYCEFCKAKRADEVVYQLLDVFKTSDSPCLLQTDNGREFVNQVINELKNMWSGQIILHAKSRHSRNQDSVEYANQDNHNMMMICLQTIILTLG